ncbi:MAG: sigma-54-dependent Fis family transcriptional regulator [Planctomycetaceae bacterium TMED240]|nr:sigma-54-dependent Fis family transcriptional regulator [Rhodopirellula sp.]OUX05707.1 MAG: sigma-54-dependent Fis family transcriptional regulator [Planctomycetaceae bacterium TMED240]
MFPAVMSWLEGNTGGIVNQASGRWIREIWMGNQEDVPELLIGETLDLGKIQYADGWFVAPMVTAGHRDQVEATGLPDDAPLVAALLVSAEESNEANPRQFIQRLHRITELLIAAFENIDGRHLRIRRVNQLQAVLDASAQWQRLEDDTVLLHGIADTATELLDCERASIFLWDKRRKKLIGRPALGVAEGALEVDDDVGVVGEVLGTQESKIWNGGSDDESRVNRKVDQSLEFETRSLVAVPMHGQRNDLIGVFEAINHNGEGFEASDATVLRDLATHAAVAIQSLKTRKKLAATCDRLVEDAASASPLIGEHPSITKIRKTSAKVAKTDLSVLVLGKNGTGKEVLARHIHFESERRNAPFIAVNCAALVESLLESELFGHEKGAFTDANQTRQGKFELASSGTLFLDEVGDMSPGGQAKLLRVLEEKVVVRVGGSQTIPVDVRVIAATNQPLEEMIAEKRFREDLYFRLNVVNLSLPPLSQRGDDILLLANHFLEQFCYQIGRSVPVFQRNAQDALQSHPWPGNIRELRNTIERVAYLCGDQEIEKDDLMLTTALRNAGQGHLPITGTLNDATRQFQVEHIERAIEMCSGNMTDAAAYLGLHRSNIYRKMGQLGMKRPEDDERSN